MLGQGKENRLGVHLNVALPACLNLQLTLASSLSNSAPTPEPTWKGGCETLQQQGQTHRAGTLSHGKTAGIQTLCPGVSTGTLVAA